MPEGTVSKFIDHHYRHFNAAVVKDAALAYRKHIADGGRMLVSLAGAMSTAELGLSLAEMIRKDKVHAISCTGANLEEDVYNLVAHDHYRRIPEYRHLTSKDEAMRRIEGVIMELWKKDDQTGNRRFPHEYFFEVLQKGLLKKHYQIDPKDSWMVAAAEKNLPMVVPGWEDSTLGNMFAAACIQKTVGSPQIVKSGVEYMIAFSDWYQKTQKTPLGFFQIGGGIAGDFPICVVPMLHQDLKKPGVPLWGYFCQISDSTTSYGSYSGAVPNEKITWGKLGSETPRFVIESDATIVAPLVFAYVLGQ